MHKFIIMGAQGCGKGTQAKLLCKELNLVHISVGDIFRWNIQFHTKLAARIQRIVESGRLVPDEIVDEIVRSRLDNHDWNYGFILDGYPRNHSQAETFLESYDVDAVIHIEVTDDVVLKRILSRRMCLKCHLDYNLIFHRPEVENTCDVCGEELAVRDDDTEEAVRKRLKDFREKTEPALELFRGKELVVTADGSRSAEEVYGEILKALEKAGAVKPS